MQTYQYLVGLGDLRIKYKMPPGGVHNVPKPMLDYLNLVLKNAALGGPDTKPDILLLRELNERFFHPDRGFDMSMQNAFREFLQINLTPRLHYLGMSSAFVT